MALQDPPCYALAWQVWQKLLTSFDWDGVNVAELYFEPDTSASTYTPFSKSALNQYGADPAIDPEAFARFRTRLVTQLTRQLLSSLNGLPNAASLEFQVTVIDDVLDPGFAQRLGSSVDELARVAADGGAALQVEDPFTVWATPPQRYTKLASTAAARMPPGAVVVDLNVVPRSGAHPTSSMTGAELDLAAAAAAERSGRVAFYSLGTLTDADLKQLPLALAGSVITEDDFVSAPWAITVSAPDRGSTTLRVDGRPWPTMDGQGVVPAGRHTLKWAAGSEPGPGLRSITAELGTASVSAKSMTLDYSARTQALVVISQRAVRVLVDGTSAAVIQRRNPSAGWTLSLPKGNHRVQIDV